MLRILKGVGNNDIVSERLRRWTRNPLGSARRGSNPLAVGLRRGALVEHAQRMDVYGFRLRCLTARCTFLFPSVGLRAGCGTKGQCWRVCQGGWDLAYSPTAARVQL